MKNKEPKILLFSCCSASVWRVLMFFFVFTLTFTSPAEGREKGHLKKVLRKIEMQNPTPMSRSMAKGFNSFGAKIKEKTSLSSVKRNGVFSPSPPEDKAVVLDQKVEFSTFKNCPPMSPHLEPLPGEQHTMSRYELPERSALELKYKVDHAAELRFTMNEENKNSPINVPLNQEADLVSARAAMTVALPVENTKLHIGAEHQRLPGESPSSNSATGAELGLSLSF